GGQEAPLAEALPHRAVVGESPRSAVDVERAVGNGRAGRERGQRQKLVPRLPQRLRHAAQELAPLGEAQIAERRTAALSGPGQRSSEIDAVRGGASDRLLGRWIVESRKPGLG